MEWGRDIVQETGINTIPMEKKCKEAKWLSGKALQIAVKRREAKSKGQKERYKHLMQHRNSMLANMASSLILEKRIITTTAKAKALRLYVEPDRKSVV